MKDGISRIIHYPRSRPVPHLPYRALLSYSFANAICQERDAQETPAIFSGRIGIVFNGSPLFTGDAGSGESNIRQWIIENDWLEAVVALPDQLK